jgi:CheY-like chemotaxis protein
MEATLPVLLLGDTGRSEFRDATNLLRDQGAKTCSDLSSALAALQNGFSPAVIVAVQSWPGRFSPGDLDTLRRAAPLARIVRLQGTWLEGELRTGRAYPGTLRTYGSDAMAYFSQDLFRIACGHSSSWTMPVTANNQDILLENSSCGAFNNGTPAEDIQRTATNVIAIHARHRETAESLAGLCAGRGWRSFWQREAEPAMQCKPDAILLDAADGAPAALAAIAKLKRATCAAPIVVLAGFARDDEIEQLRAAGAQATLCKPFVADNLVWHLDRILLSAQQE